MTEKKPGSYWEPSEDLILRNLRSEGKTIAQIAEEMGRPKNGVKRRIARLKAMHAKRPPDEPEEVQQPVIVAKPPRATTWRDEVYGVIQRKKPDTRGPWERWMVAVHELSEEKRAA